MEKEELFSLDPHMLALLQQCADYFAQHQYSVYVVGGSSRNLLLREPYTDWDFAIHGNIPQIARQLADHLHGFSVHMHEKASRVVVKRDGKEIIFDLAPLHGSTIETDLLERDFTINAIALPFTSLLAHLSTQAPLTVIDPFSGRADLHTRTLRAVDANVFRTDPLRLLRAVRFLIHYHLSLDQQTAQWIQRDASLLPQVATERIHEELYAILQAPQGTAHLRLLDHLGLLTVLFPELLPARGMAQPELHHWDVFDHSLETVSMLELLATLLCASDREISTSPLALETQDDLLTIRDLLQEAEQQKIFQFARMHSPQMKLAALLHDIGKPPTYTIDETGTIRFYGHPQAGVPLAQNILHRLGASTHDRRLVQQVVAHHMRPGQLSHTEISERAIRRYFVELGPVGLHVALVSLADHLAMRGPEPLTQAWQRHLSTVRLLFTRYIRERERILPPRLLQGEELIHRLNLKPGPIIGHLLEMIAEAQAEGRVHSKDEALWLAEEYLSHENAT
jgi:poly(A) polymerase